MKNKKLTSLSHHELKNEAQMEGRVIDDFKQIMVLICGSKLTR